MDDSPIPARDEEHQIYGRFTAQCGEPAFARRGRLVVEAFEQLLHRCRQKRTELQVMVRLRIGMLRALASDWATLRPLLADDTQVALLRELHEELAPQLRVPIKPTSSARTLRRTLEVLVESIVRFNRRWQDYLPSVQLAHINGLREGYNRYYVLEKECALRSPAVARAGFRQLEPLTLHDLAALLPLLPVPQLSA